MFKPVPSSPNLIQIEEGVLRSWKNRHIFEKSKSLRQDAQPFVFYEGPSTANHKPKFGQVLGYAFKDLFLRYKSMKGFRVIRRGGWDTHGLPVEIEVEKELGFRSKSQIEDYGIDRFNQRCRQSAFTYVQDWEKLIDRTAFWLDLDDAYVTYTNDYIESVWWALKSLWDKDLLYQGFKVVPYCPRCGTPLSDHEVSLGYRETVEPSIYVRLPLVEEPGTSLLVWTSSPWSLPGNVAVAAHPEEDYVIVERPLPDGGEERMIVAKSQLAGVFQDEPVEVYETFKGKKLKNLHYKPLFTFLLPEKRSHYVVLTEFVNSGEGTGLVHIAPAFGADDLQAAIDHDLPIFQTITEEGMFVPEVRPWSGKFFKEVDEYIVQDLHYRGLLYKSGTFAQDQPFCWCCDTRLLYYARSTWQLRTSKHRDQLVSLNQQINWVPNHVKDGRFGNWLENNVDWALGRERYWGTPLPVWECTACHHQLAVGSINELSDLAGEDVSELDLHRPHIDQVHIACPRCSEQMNRTPEIIDVWFDSGSMPAAQWHYPFESETQFKDHFPADFICEGVGHARAWFYALHSISALLFDQAGFKNAIHLDLNSGRPGRGMPKSQDGTVDPWDVLNKHGADALRWCLYTASPPDQEQRLSFDLVAEAIRNFSLPLWNLYHLFITCALVDNWTPSYPALSETVGEGDQGGAGSKSQILDRWLFSELQALIRDVTEGYENYDVPGATRPVQTFVVTKLSQWWLHHSRYRFRKSETGNDKNAAYATLYQSLVILSRLLAPAIPLLCEELYQNLVASVDAQAPESVHLSDWPAYQESLIDESLNAEMTLVMKLASLGHTARNQARISIRQPLAEAAFSVATDREKEVIERYNELLADDLNLKKVRVLYSDVELNTEARAGQEIASEGSYQAALNVELTPELIQEGLAREFVHHVKNRRKQADLDLTQRIRLYVIPSSGLAQAIEDHREYVMAESVAVELTFEPAPEGVEVEQVSFDGEHVRIGMEKAPD